MEILMFKKIILFIVTAASFLGILLPYFASGMVAQKAYCDSLKTRKLYASDFKELGVEYSNSLKNSKGELLAESRYKEVPLYLKFINDTVGFGVFAEQDTRHGANVGEYTGEVITLEETTKIKNLDEGAFLFALDAAGPAQLFVDARKSGNFTRFINHSFNPNLMVMPNYNKDNPTVVLVARRDIKRDKELLLDYGHDYWDARGIEPAELK